MLPPQEPPRSSSSCRICGGLLDGDGDFCEQCATLEAGVSKKFGPRGADGVEKTGSAVLMACPGCNRKVAARELNGLCPSCLFDALEDDDDEVNSCEMPEVPGYRMLHLLGRGGMGVVWLAEQLGTKQRVAVKLCLSRAAGLGGAGNEPLLRFAREIELTAGIHHPGIARVFDGGETEGVPYCVMEYVDGPNLAEYVRGHQLDLRQIVVLVRQVCEAVQHAHQNGVMHRDLKPSNILVTTEGQPKVLDFGLAKALGDGGGRSQDLTLTGQLLGTPRYMAPEQVSGGSLDTRTDVYALGVILYELLTRAHPHDGTGSRDAMLHRIATEEPKRPRVVRRDLDAELEMLLLKALQKEPEARYRSAGDVADDLGRWLRSEPLAAGKATLWYFVRKWLVRHRLAVFVGIGVAAVVLSSAVLMRSATHTVEEYTSREAGRLHRDGIGAENSGNHKQAIEELEQSARLRQKRLGSDHPDTLEAKNDLAIALQKQGEPGRALPLFRDVLERREQKLGPDHPHVLLSMNNLAGCYLDLADSEAALALSETTFQRSKNVLGLDDPDTLKIMSNLARAWRVAGSKNKTLLGEAIPLYEEALSRSRSKLGPNHPDTLTCLNNLAVALDQAGEFDKAVLLYEEAFKRSEEEGDLGSNHPDILTIESNLAGDYYRTGRIREAISRYEHALKKGRATPGADHRDTLTTMINLAIAYEAAGQLPDALPLYAESLAARTLKLGADHPETLKLASFLATARWNAGMRDEALPLFAGILEKRRATCGPEHPDTLRSVRNLAIVYREMQNFKKALPLYEEYLKAQKKQLSGNDLNLVHLEREFEEVQTQSRALPSARDGAHLSEPAQPRTDGDKQLE